MEGYIKLYRQLIESRVFSNQTALKIWIWCLLKANHKERFIPLNIGKGIRTIKVSPGQFIFGRFRAEEELNIDGSSIYRWLKKFESKEFDMISIDANNQYSIISICNWRSYQSNNDEVEQPMSNQCTRHEPDMNTNKNVNNVKNSIPLKVEVYSFNQFWNDYDKKVGKKDKLISKWSKLTDQDKLLIKEYIPRYKQSRSDKQYRKDPETFLNNQSWNDEIITNGSENKVTNKLPEILETPKEWLQ
jgi:hypothetical protein